MGLGTMWGEGKAREMLAHASFTHVELRRVDEDVANNYYMATKG